MFAQIYADLLNKIQKQLSLSFGRKFAYGDYNIVCQPGKLSDNKPYGIRDHFLT